MEKQPDYLAIYDDFAGTEYGQTLVNSLRYEVYRPDHVSHGRWVELLGPDADNLRHLISTYHLTNRFIETTDRLQPDELNPWDKTALRIGAITHDCAEAIITDINYSDKTAAHETQEQAAFNAHLELFFPNSDPETINTIREAAQEIVFNRYSRLGRIFNAVERLGYLGVATRAGQHLRDDTALDCAPQLIWLASDTISNHHTTHVIAAGRRFPAAHDILVENLTEIDQLLDTVSAYMPVAFADFDPARAIVKTAHFNAAKEIWDSWRG